MLSSLRGLWSRHRRKVYIGLGLLGSGYVLYKLYDAQRKRILDLDKQLEGERQVDELIKDQLQTHFENIQRISDTTTLPYAMLYLKSQISEELNLSHLTDRLAQQKGQPNTLTPKEKRELWERLKVLSFTRTASSLWSVTMLCLYVRAQVNILGRHLYLEIARASERSQQLDEAGSYSRHGQQEFLATADYLSSFGVRGVIMNMQNAAMEVLKEKQLQDPLNKDQLQATIMHILELFMSIYAKNHWIGYLVPENATTYRQLMATSSNGFDDSSMLMDTTKLEQLMSETREVLSSDDFMKIVKTSLENVVDALVEDIGMRFQGINLSSAGIPLAKLLAQITQLGESLLEEPSCNKFVQIVWSLPDVQVFYTLLYANMAREF